MNVLAESLEKDYMDYAQPEEAAEKEKFVVKDIKSAEWCLKRIAWHQKRKAAALEFVTAEKEKLEEYLAKVNSEEDGSIEYFKELLKPFAMEQLEGSKKKTVTLPSGSLSFKRQAPEFIKDDEVLLAFVKESTPKYLKVKESVDWDAMKKACQIDDDRLITEDGEIVQGITVRERDDSFMVKVKE